MINKIWLQYYPQHIPPEIDPNIYSSIVELFEASCKKYANKPAVSNLGTVLTFAELDEKSRDFAAYLQKELKLEKGERVAIMLPNILQYPVVLYGILRAGLVVVNLNPLYTSREVEYILKDAEPSAIITMANFAHTLQSALSQAPVKHIIITEVGDLFPPVKAFITNFMVKHIKKLVPSYQITKAISFKKVMLQGHKLAFKPVHVNPEDTAFLQYTGGTTGVEKAAMLMHSNIVANVEQTVAWVTKEIREGQEVLVAPLPLYHIFALTVCTFCFLKLGGLTVLITNPRDISGLLRELSKTPFTVILGINTLFNALLNHPEFSKLDFKLLRLTIAGGMPLQESIAQHWRRVTNSFVTEGYGLTEASPVVTINPIDIQEFTGSIGMPLPSTDISIQDDAGNEVPLGERGELCIKGPQVMKSYWRNDEETRKVFTEDGWLRTGDIAYMNEKGYIYVVDRKKDMILVSGFNVYPNEVEDVIASHPGVKEVAVIGIASIKTGEAIKAFVVKSDITLTQEELVAFCRERLTAYKIPYLIEFRDSLPKSSIGKILRRELRRQGSKS